MNKTNETSNLITLADSELDAVTGGTIPGESNDDHFYDGTNFDPPTPPTPGGAWNGLLRNYGYIK